MPPTVSWPTRSPSYVTTNGIVRPCARLAAQPAHHRGVRRWRVALRRRGSWPPTAAATRRCASRTSRHRASSRRRSGRGARRRRRAGSTGQRGGQPCVRSGWSPPLIWSTACTSSGSSTAEAVLHPAGRAGEVDDERALARDPGDPAGERRGGHAVGQRPRHGSPRRCPGAWRRDDLAGVLGRHVRGREPGAAGGDHDVEALVHRARAGSTRSPGRPAPRWARRPRTRAPAGDATITGPVRSSYTPAAARVEIATTSALIGSRRCRDGATRRSCRRASPRRARR